MKKLYIYLIFTLLYCNLSFSQDYEISVVKLDGPPASLEFYLTALTPTAPTSGTLWDLTYTLEFPTAALVTFPLNTATGSLMIKAGPITTSGLNSRQGFQIADPEGDGAPLPAGMVTGVPIKIGEIPITIMAAGTNTINVIPAGVISGQPNLNVDLIQDYTPSIGAAAALPIKLKKFIARPLVDNRGSDLRWTSSSEVNASHFEVERSSDATNFEYVATVRATGNTNWDVDYSLVDNNLPFARTGSETFYYRLKQVDLDGKFEYSEIRSVNFDNELSVQMGPNPTASILNIHISTPANDITDAPVAIFDATGKLVMKKMVSTNGVTTIDLSEVANGNYMVRINHNNKNYDTKIIKSN